MSKFHRVTVLTTSVIHSIAIALSLLSPLVYADGSDCQKYLPSGGNPTSSAYEIGGIAFRIPISQSSLELASSYPAKTPTVSFYYSLEDHRFFDLHDKARPPCRGWCSNVLVMITTGRRRNNVAYRVAAISALSEGGVVDDPYMRLAFERLRNTKKTSYWQLRPDRHALLRCGPVSDFAQSCEWAFDYAPSVEVKMEFGKAHLAQARDLLDTMNSTLDCLRGEQ